MTLVKLISIASGLLYISSALILYKFSTYLVFGAGYENEETIKEKIRLNKRIRKWQRIGVGLAIIASLFAISAIVIG